MATRSFETWLDNHREVPIPKDGIFSMVTGGNSGTPFVRHYMLIILYQCQYRSPNYPDWLFEQLKDLPIAQQTTRCHCLSQGARENLMNSAPVTATIAWAPGRAAIVNDTELHTWRDTSARNLHATYSYGFMRADELPLLAHPGGRPLIRPPAETPPIDLIDLRPFIVPPHTLAEYTMAEWNTLNNGALAWAPRRRRWLAICLHEEHERKLRPTPSSKFK